MKQERKKVAFEAILGKILCALTERMKETKKERRKEKYIKKVCI